MQIEQLRLLLLVAFASRRQLRRTNDASQRGVCCAFFVAVRRLFAEVISIFPSSSSTSHSRPQPNDFDLLTLPVLEFSRLRAAATNNDNTPPEATGADEEGLMLQGGSAGPAAMQVDGASGAAPAPGTRAGPPAAAAEGAGVIGRGLPGSPAAAAAGGGVVEMTEEQAQGGPPVVACSPDDALMTVR